jgi:hypothetical protein
MDAIQFRFTWSVLLTSLKKPLVLSIKFGIILLGHASTSKTLIRPRHDFEGSDAIYQEPSKKERLFPNVCTCLHQEDQPHTTPPSLVLSMFSQLQGKGQFV